MSPAAKCQAKIKAVSRPRAVPHAQTRHRLAWHRWIGWPLTALGLLPMTLNLLLGGHSPFYLMLGGAVTASNSGGSAGSTARNEPSQGAPRHTTHLRSGLVTHRERTER